MEIEDSRIPDVNADLANPLAEMTEAWFALQVSQRHEQTVSMILENKGLTPYLPLRRRRLEWSDRTVERQTPLFPGYLFCRLDLGKRLLPVLTTPGVVRILGLGRTPIPVSDEEIESIQQMARSGLDLEPCQIPKIGDRVRIRLGPLRGLEGTLVGLKTRRRFVVSVQLLNRGVAVEIDAECASPIQ